VAFSWAWEAVFEWRLGEVCLLSSFWRRAARAANSDAANPKPTQAAFTPTQPTLAREIADVGAPPAKNGASRL